MFDLAIIGGGPAGMTAAIYAANAGLDVVIIESLVFGGQMSTTYRIENYPSVQICDGAQLSQNMKAQMDSLGVKSIYATVESITKTDDVFEIATTSKPLSARTVIAANGVKRRKLGVSGESKLSGRGVSWCAVCDGGFFKGKDVAVIGGANSAMKEAMHLSSICNRVYVLYRRDKPTADEVSIRSVKNTENIVMCPNTIVTCINGEKSVSSITIQNVVTQSSSTLEVSGVFEAIGLIPDNGMLAQLVEFDENGYIVTDENCQTKTKGLFAAGDTRKKALRQIITACADGAVCATAASELCRTDRLLVHS